MEKHDLVIRFIALFCVFILFLHVYTHDGDCSYVRRPCNVLYEPRSSIDHPFVTSLFSCLPGYVSIFVDTRDMSSMSARANKTHFASYNPVPLYCCRTRAVPVDTSR